MVTRTPFFYDVTLRDGNQALRKPWSPAEKETVFGFLRQLGVQGAELGYPGASQLDFDGFVRLADSASCGMVIGALARTNERDVNAALAALSQIKRGKPMLHTFIGMSPFHMQEVLKKTPQEVRQMAIEAVTLARAGLGEDGEVQFSPEHFGDCRENLEWVIESLQAIVQAGANVINLPNTVERYRPSVFVEMVRAVVEALSDHVRIAVHPHNDLGMATATTVESFFAGATQLEVTLNGLGERAGNTNIYEVAVALANCGVEVSLKLEAVYDIALQIAEMSGVPIPTKAPLISSECFRHRSGIHQHGTVRTAGNAKGAYRPINPAIIGRAGDEELRFTSQSGYTAVAVIVRETGRIITNEEARLLQPALKAVSEGKGELEPDELAAVFDAYKDLQAKKAEVSQADILALAKDVISRRGERVWELVSAMVTAGTGAKTATVCLSCDGKQIVQAALGDGPVDAAYNAMRAITGFDVSVDRYHIENITGGADAQGEVAVVLSHDGKNCEGRGADTDIVLASIKAYLNALNRLLRGETNGVIE